MRQNHYHIACNLLFHQLLAAIVQFLHLSPHQLLLRAGHLLVLLLLLLLLAGASFAQDAAFAFANQKGNALLTIAPRELSAFTEALDDHLTRPELGRTQAERARRWVLEAHARERSLDAYAAFFRRLAAR